ncbi:MAG: GNAT family N-acetyltransferase [Chloroflexota bacterium]
MKRLAVGQISFKAPPDEAGMVELGYGVNPSAQGRGYATEMARALTEWAIEQPSVSRVTSECLEDNVASIRVLEKAGFERIGGRLDEEGSLILWQYPVLSRQRY